MTYTMAGERLPGKIYFKALHAMNICKHGLESFVTFGIDQFRNDTLRDIRRKHQLDDEAICSNCDTDDILECPTKGVCKRGKCDVHEKGHIPFCKNQICHNFSKQISSWHKLGNPSFKNIDARKWCIQGDWELAKCFMPCVFENQTTCAESTDFSGLLTIIINCASFDILCKDKEIFKEARRNRNKIMHSPNLDLVKKDLDDFIAVVVHLLSDPVWLGKCENAKSAVSNLIELREGRFFIENDDKETTRDNMDKEYELEKRRFQSSLMTFIEEHLLMVPVCPGEPEENTLTVDEMYVLQSLREENPRHVANKEEEEDKKIDTYEKIFKKEGKLYYKDVYITGPAGIGKTILSKRILSKWCSLVKNGDNATGDDTVIQEFDFVFPIMMRDVETGTTDVVGMVKRQLLEEFPWFADFFFRVVQDEKNKCLFILDGLDEWRQQDDNVFSKPPDRNSIKHCFFVTLCRPWKLEALRLTSKPTRRSITIAGFDDRSSEQLIHKVVGYLNARFNRHDEAESFISLLQKRKLDSLQRIPVILEQLICMWSDEKTLVNTNTRCEIYSKMVEFLLKNFDKKQQRERRRSTLQSKTGVNLPKVLLKLPNCQKYGTTLQQLARLAFHASFETKLEFSLVFECDSDEERELISEEQKRVCLESGLLSQNIVTRKATARHRKLSFLHKSFHDFFVALHVGLSTDQPDVFDKIRKVCSSNEKVLAMEEMFVFLSGLNPNAMRTIADHFTDVLNRQENTQKLRELLKRGLDYRNTVKLVQNMLLCCLKECSSEPSCMALRCDDIYVDLSTIRERSLPDLVCMNAKYIRNVRINVPNSYTDCIPERLKRALFSCNRLEYLSIYIDKHFTKDDTMKILEGSFDTIKYLNMWQVKEGSEAFLWSHWDKLKSIEILRLEHMTIQCAQVQRLTHLLSSRAPNIRVLQIQSLHCYEHPSCRKRYTIDANAFPEPGEVSVQDSHIEIHNAEEGRAKEVRQDSTTSLCSLSSTDDQTPVKEMIYCY